MLQQAIDLSKELRIPNLQWNSVEVKYQKDADAQDIWNTVNGDLFDIIDLLFRPYPYLGNMCLDLTSTAFMYLKARGFDAEMVYGNVNINGSPDDEFDTTPSLLKHEYENKIKEGEQDIHAWVGLGGNIIVDFGIPDRLVKNYKYPRSEIFCVGPADSFKEKLKIEYKPMLIGSGFFKQTNAYDPLDDKFEFKSLFSNI